VQSNELFPVLAIALSLIAVAGLTAVWLMLRSYRRNQRVIMGSRERWTSRNTWRSSTTS